MTGKQMPFLKPKELKNETDQYIPQNKNKVTTNSKKEKKKKKDAIFACNKQ